MSPVNGDLPNHLDIFNSYPCLNNCCYILSEYYLVLDWLVLCCFSIVNLEALKTMRIYSATKILYLKQGLIITKYQYPL